MGTFYQRAGIFDKRITLSIPANKIWLQRSPVEKPIDYQLVITQQQIQGYKIMSDLNSGKFKWRVSLEKRMKYQKKDKG